MNELACGLALWNDIMGAPAVCAALMLIWPLETLLKWLGLFYRIVTGRDP